MAVFFALWPDAACGDNNFSLPLNLLFNTHNSKGFDTCVIFSYGKAGFKLLINHAWIKGDQLYWPWL